jgi:hypothetical protein
MHGAPQLAFVYHMHREDVAARRSPDMTHCLGSAACRSDQNVRTLACVRLAAAGACSLGVRCLTPAGPLGVLASLHVHGDWRAAEQYWLVLLVQDRTRQGRGTVPANILPAAAARIRA